MFSDDMPILSLEECGEDIDILSELINTNSNTSQDYDVTGNLDVTDVDQLTSYFGPNDSTFLDVESDHSTADPYLKGTATSVHRSPMSTDNGIQIPVLSSNSVQHTNPNLIVMPRPPSNPCMSKNAVAARENRLKKKSYMTQLEKDCCDVRQENQTLKTKLALQENRVENLSAQVAYLQSVIANQSTLSALLKNIQNTDGVTLKSSWSDLPKSNNAPLHQKPDKYVENEENEKSLLRRSKRKCVFESEIAVDNKRLRYKSNEKEEISAKEKCVPDGKVFPHPPPNPTKFDLCDVKPTGEVGICLHVVGSEVSLEFCAACSAMATAAKVLDDHSYVRSHSDN